MYIDIQNDIHKDGLFSIKRHTCTFLPSVVTGIGLHCLNDNNEKKCLADFVCLFVLEGEKHSRSLDVGSIHVHDLKLLLLIESMDKKCVFFYFNFLFALCLSL